MKFIIKKNILLENLLNTSKAISSKNLIPILTGIKFELKEDGLYLSASDSDISIRTFIPNDKITEVQQLGSIVISGKYIVEIIRKLPDNDIIIEVIDGYNMIIQTQGSEFNLNGIDPNEFPNLDLEETKNPIVLNPVIFKNIINQTFFATSLSETRPLLTGINFKLSGNMLEVIATDSYRLARKQIEYSKELPEIKVVIPGKSLDELYKILEDTEGAIEIHCSSSKILFKYQNLLFQSRLINGIFPNIETLIPEKYLLSLKFNKEELISAIDRVSIFVSNELSNIIKLNINNHNSVEFSSSSNEIGGAVEEVSLLSKSSEVNFEVAFSSKYFLDALKTFDSKEVTLNFTGEIKPITVEAEYDHKLIQLILPVRSQYLIIILE